MKSIIWFCTNEIAFYNIENPIGLCLTSKHGNVSSINLILYGKLKKYK